MDRHTTRTALNAISNELDEHGSVLTATASKVDEILALCLATNKAVTELQRKLGPALDQVQEIPDIRRRLVLLEDWAHAQ